MKKLLLITLLLCYSFTNAQITFEKGYFISNNGNRTECYIKNLDWKNNPTDFKYKLQLTDSEFQTSTGADTQEFGIDNESTYKKFKIKIDRSSDDPLKLTSNRNPDWREETLFLKTLVEGDATLYSYTEDNMNRFFYATKTIPTEQLIYVKYLITEQSEGAEKIGENNEYKQQLYKNVATPTTTEKSLLNLTYKKADLVAYFSKYNNLNPDSVKNENTKKTKSKFFIKITPGVSFASLSSTNDADNQLNAKLDKKAVFRIGAEFEYVLPYNKNKWSVFINPTYQKYQNEKDYGVPSPFITFPNVEYTIKASYSSLQLPIGIRHYMFLNENSKIFINYSYTIDVSSKTDITYTNKTASNASGSFTGDFAKNSALGIGYNFKNKFSAEIRFNTKKELVNYTYHSAKYNAIDFIFAYTIF
ncbi:PorT family protein [Flavobacterium sp. Fl-318]|uniref:PorT family protein n=1 Tax=Flavobacterium cupriresistens TaxID=2893885 RepID=A0ABU4RFL5_9FLAO|nr:MULTISPECIES: PorT family protein [unclassified Flavobacterium]MDX6191399.1 PorT family protein [Flavobacterium sp. Fl-318]UFH43164.1 PorT family protein [Flavobacterium sp. F-323]